MTSRNGRARHISNSIYSVLDYVSLPALMLLATPILLHHLGPDRYVIWILTSATVTSGYLVSSGFNDAAIKLICSHRGKKDATDIQELVRVLLALNLILSAVIAGAIALSCPLLERRMPALGAHYRNEFQLSLLLGCILLIVRAVESVFISVQRAYERYDIPARFSIAVRVLTIGAVSLIAYIGGNTVSMLLALLGITLFGVLLQAVAIRRHLPQIKLLPLFSTTRIHQLRSIGIFTWIQGIVGLLTSQADRFLVGALLGTQALAYYTVSVQAAMPIHGIAVASLQILFPYLASRLELLEAGAVRRRVMVSFLVNAGIVAALAVPMILGSKLILTLWLGAGFAAHATMALRASVLGFALMGLNVTGYFVLMALGKMRLLVILNVAATVAMLSTMAVLSPRMGLPGALAGRIVFGALICLVYVPVVTALRGRSIVQTISVDALEVAR